MGILRHVYRLACAEPAERDGPWTANALRRRNPGVTEVSLFIGYIIAIWIALSSSVILQNAWILRTLQVRQISLLPRSTRLCWCYSLGHVWLTHISCGPLLVQLPNLPHHLVRHLVVVGPTAPSRPAHSFFKTCSLFFRLEQASRLRYDRNSPPPPVYPSPR
jgi:hypothetical protein